MIEEASLLERLAIGSLPWFLIVAWVLYHLRKSRPVRRWPPTRPVQPQDWKR